MLVVCKKHPKEWCESKIGATRMFWMLPKPLVEISKHFITAPKPMSMGPLKLVSSSYVIMIINL